MKKSHNTTRTTTIITAIIGVNSFTKSIKDNPAALPIIIFGGSPINVAVPPIFDAKISVKRKGIGLISNLLAIKKVTGIINITVVTLSKNADAIAVNSPSANNIPTGCPLVSFKS